MTIIRPDPAQGYGANLAARLGEELKKLETEINEAIRSTPVGEDVVVLVGVPTGKKRKGSVVFEGYSFDALEQSVQECRAAGWVRAGLETGTKEGIECMLLRLTPPRPRPSREQEPPRTEQDQREAL